MYIASRGALRLVLIGLCLLVKSDVVAAQAQPFTGRWSYVDRLLGDGTDYIIYIDLQENNGLIVGQLDFPAKKLSIHGSELSGDSVILVDEHNRIVYEAQKSGKDLYLISHMGPTYRSSVVAHPDASMRLPPLYIAIPSLHAVTPNGLALTPPMGWNSWNRFSDKIDEATVRKMADVIVSSGMRDAGYIYVNIDEGWEGLRTSDGVLHPNSKFPDMKKLADYVHSKGLKLGIYSSPGEKACDGYEGSYGHEEQDAQAFASWGVDYLKYDWCGAGKIYGKTDMRAVYQRMSDALRSSGRPIVYSLSAYGSGSWLWGALAGGNLWRTTGDISDNWSSVVKNGFSSQNDLAPYAGIGHWNDPDMLEVGNGGMSDTEYRAHMSLWALLAAPLLAGNDLSTMSRETLDILTNREVIAIDQDPVGIQGARLRKDGDCEIWTRHLANGALAIGMFNLGGAPARVAVTAKELGMANARMARDVWNHRNLSLKKGMVVAQVPAHGVTLLQIAKPK